MSDDDEIKRLEERLRELKGENTPPPEEPAPSDTPKPPVAPQWAKTPNRTVLADNNRFAVFAIVGAVLVMAVILTIATSSNGPRPTPKAANTAAEWDPDALSARAAAAKAATPPPAPVYRWAYTRSTDPMDDSTVQMACVRSENEAYLSPPYQPLHAQLCVRRTSKWGLDVFISMLGDAQILCNSYSGCRIPTRFDDGDATNYRGNGAEDYSTNIAFITDGSAAGFVEKLKSADTTKMVLTFYRDANQVMEFDTRGLQWPVPEAVSTN